MIDAVSTSDVSPISYGKNKKGMVASGEQVDTEKAKAIWDNARKNAVESARQLAALGLHKQHANRLLEPFAMITCVVTATEFDNFFALRLSHDAQPEIQELAREMEVAMRTSESVNVFAGDWHTPFILKEEAGLPLNEKVMLSIARCARVSYTVPGENKLSSIESDMAVAKKLIDERHLSPTEHVAMALGNAEKMANFRGWIQYRMFL